MKLDFHQPSCLRSGAAIARAIGDGELHDSPARSGTGTTAEGAWRWLAAGAACLATSGCDVFDHGFLSPAGPIAGAERHYFVVVCLIMLLVIGPVMILVPLIAWH